MFNTYDPFFHSQTMNKQSNNSIANETPQENGFYIQQTNHENITSVKLKVSKRRLLQLKYAYTCKMIV